jgi:hypothetical protein
VPAPALQVQSPEFKPQFHKRKKSKTKRLFLKVYSLYFKNQAGGLVEWLKW